MNIKNAFLALGTGTFFFVVGGIIVWALLTLFIAAGYYDISYFSMKISEWDGFFRVVLALYAVVGVCAVVILFFDGLNSPKY